MHIFSSWGYLHSHLSPKSEYTIVSQTLGTEQPSQYFTLRQCGGISYLRQSSFQMQSRPAHPLQMGTLSWAEVENCDLSLGKLVSSRTWAQVNNVKWPQSKTMCKSHQTYTMSLRPYSWAGRANEGRKRASCFIHPFASSKVDTSIARVTDIGHRSGLFSEAKMENSRAVLSGIIGMELSIVVEIVKLSCDHMFWIPFNSSNASCE